MACRSRARQRRVGPRAQAAATARGALDLGAQVRYPWAVAVAERALGRAGLVTDDLATARTHLAGARSGFGRMGCRFELAVTHMDLARLEQAAGEDSNAGVELNAARVLLSELDAPIYMRAAARSRSRRRHVTRSIRPPRKPSKGLGDLGRDQRAGGLALALRKVSATTRPR